MKFPLFFRSKQFQYKFLDFQAHLPVEGNIPKVRVLPKKNVPVFQYADGATDVAELHRFLICIPAEN